MFGWACAQDVKSILEVRTFFFSTRMCFVSRKSRWSSSGKELSRDTNLLLKETKEDERRRQNSGLEALSKQIHMSAKCTRINT